LARIDDPIFEAFRKHKQAHAAQFNYLEAIDLIEREKNFSRPVVNRPSRRIAESQKHGFYRNKINAVRRNRKAVRCERQWLSRFQR